MSLFILHAAKEEDKNQDRQSLPPEVLPIFSNALNPKRRS